MEISKSRRQVLMTTAMIGIAGCSSNSSNNAEGNTTQTGTTESTEDSTVEATQYKTKWTGVEGVTRIGTYDDNLYALSADGTLYSLDVEKGTPNWTNKSVGYNFLEVSNSYIVTPNSVQERSDGSILWQTNSEPRAVIGDSLYAQQGDTLDSRKLVKFDLETGSIEWETSYSYSVTGSNSGLHLLQPTDNNTAQLLTKDPSSGENVYTKEISSNASLIGTSNNSLIGLRSNDQSAFFFALDAESGDSLWETKINGGFPILGSRGRMSHILSENIIYSPVWDRENNKFTVQSHNLSNGELRWKQNVSLSIIEFSLGMAKSENTIFFGKLGQGGTKLVLLNSNNGEIRSTNPVQTMPLTIIENNLLGMVSSGEYGQKLRMFEPIVN